VNRSGFNFHGYFMLSIHRVDVRHPVFTVEHAAHGSVSRPFDRRSAMEQSTPLFVGLDVHKDSIAVAYAQGQSADPPGRSPFQTPRPSGAARR